MGAVCTAQYEGENYNKNIKNRSAVTKSEIQQQSSTKNKQVAQFRLGNHAQITTIHGHYSNHSGNVLAILSTIQNLNFSEQLRQYAHDYKIVVEKIKQDKNKINMVKLKKECPYEKMVLCVIPEYNFKDRDQNELQDYLDDFKVLIKNLFQQINDVTMYFTSTAEQGVVFPTQTMLSLLFKELASAIKSKKISMISCELKMLQMIRYQLLKTQHCKCQ